MTFERSLLLAVGGGGGDCESASPELVLEYRMAAELLGRGVSKDHMFQWAACNDRAADCHRKLAVFDSEYASILNIIASIVQYVL